VRFLEVLGDRPKIEMGLELPLRHSTRPLASSTVWLAMGATLFLVVPLAGTIQMGIHLRELLRSWWLLVIMTAGMISFVFFIESLILRSTLVITREEVLIRERGLIFKSEARIARGDFRGLVATEVHHPDWLIVKDEFIIRMTHESAALGLVLHRGRDRNKYEERAQRYPELLGLPLIRDSSPKA
jgi:hypothetical protein